MHNLILNTDSYKASHYLQYPSDTEYMSCYIEARGGRFDSTLFFGLQMFLKKYLTKPISKADIIQAEEVLHMHGLPFNKDGWKYILKEYDGYLPLYIEAVPEGSIIPTKNVLLQITNTDPKCFWLATYIETALLRAVWYPTTVATLSYQCKKIIKKFLLETSDGLDRLEYMLADFGARGVSSFESSSIGGTAHLINFFSTSTIAGLLYAKKYYNANMEKYVTIPAAEHSTIISWKKENEHKAFSNMINKFSGEGKTYAVVSDSYNIHYAVDKIWGERLKNNVINSKGTLIIRSDSGNPTKVIIEIIEILMEKFGYYINKKGYRVFKKYLRVLHGDQVSIEVIEKVLKTMKSMLISAENISFGMGSELLQKINRDTQQFAMKVSAIKRRNKTWEEVYKTPITESLKKSKKGKLAIIKENNLYKTINYNDLGSRKNILIPMFKNGKILNDISFEEIRENVKNNLVI